MKARSWNIAGREVSLRFKPMAWFIGASRMTLGTTTVWTIYPLPMLQVTVWKQP